MVQLVDKNDPVLREPTRSITEFGTKKLSRLKDEMIVVLRATKGVGIAAPQIGSDMAAAIVRFEGRATMVINPRIVASDKWYINIEGCLSLPGQRYRVPRPAELKISYQEEDGTFKERTIWDKDEAAIFHHEYCHLQGILLDDISLTTDALANYKRNRPSMSFEQLQTLSEVKELLSLFNVSKNNLKKDRKKT